MPSLGNSFVVRPKPHRVATRTSLHLGMGKGSWLKRRNQDETAVKLSGRNHFVALAVIAVVAGVSLLGGWLRSQHSKRSRRITGSLTALGPIDFALESMPGKAISPVCGCYRVKDSKEWRGITFAVRSIQIVRREHAHTPATEEKTPYMISAANPEPAHWESGELFFAAELLTFESQSEYPWPTFDPAGVPRGQDPAGW